MSRYILRRLIEVVPVLIGVSILAFSMSHLVPGDPVVIMLGERATGEDVERLREDLGLNRPIHEQYLNYVSNALRGDLGTSIRTGQPVMREILDRLPSTIQLTVSAILVSILVGVTAGAISAITSRKWLDLAIMSFVLIGISTPTFFSGLLLILFFSLYLEWLPIASGSGIQALILPTIALAAPAVAVLARITRSGMLEELGKDYVRTAYSKGLEPRTVLFGHVLKNALIPVVTIIGLQFGGLMAGAVIVESVFARPGLGRYAVTAISARDFPQIQGIVLVVAVVYVFTNLAVDLLYALIDPRIKYQ